MAYIGRVPQVGNYFTLDAITTSATDTFNLLKGGVAYVPETAYHLIVSLNGVIQAPITAYTVSGSTIVFASSLASTDSIDFITVLGDTLAIGTPSDATVGEAQMKSTIDLSSKTLTLPAASVTAHVTSYDDNKLQSNIALLGFKTAVNGSLAKYNLQDQIIDEYTDATGIDASASTNEVLSSGSYSGGSGSNPTGGSSTGSYSHGGTTYYFNKFTADTNFVTTDGGNADIFLIGGGGGANYDNGGGGGAGGMIWKPNHTFAGSTTFAVDIGAGGTGRTSSADPTNGEDTTFASTTFIAKGGGYGGRHGVDGAAGGSGGGAGRNYSPSSAAGASNQSSQSGDSGTYGFGFAGGAGRNDSEGPAGGGGGTGAVGSAGVSGTRGAGGDGKSDFVNSSATETTAFLLATTSGTDSSNVATTGSSSGTLYIGGGGGGSTQNASWATAAGGEGGKGGGADSPNGATTTTGGNGLVNTGGGGGSANGQTSGGDGGSGLVIIRYTDSSFVTVGDLTLQSTDTTAMAQPSTGDMVTLIENSSGTATLNTDIKGYISRDSGTTFTQGTLVDEGTWGTNKKILAFHDLDISGQPSGTSMCYKITTHNQSAGSKETKIHATSIGWK